MVCSSARKYRPLRNASANLVPSAEMPKPENIRRIVTGPKSAKRSIRKSRSMRAVVPANAGTYTPCHLVQAMRSRPSATIDVRGYGSRPSPGRRQLSLSLRRRQLYRLPAAAGAGLVRIVEDELRLHLVGLVVHLGAEQEQHRLGIDQDLDALVLDDLVGRADIVGVFDGVGLAGTAAVLDADAQAHDLGIGPLGQLVDALGSSVRQPHHLRARPPRLRSGCWC